jgi:hypothetical protein
MVTGAAAFGLLAMMGWGGLGVGAGGRGLPWLLRIPNMSMT